MQPALSNTTRLALVIAIIVVVVLAIHMITMGAKNGRKPAVITLCTLVVLLLGFAGLFALSNGTPDPVELEDFSAPAFDDTGAVAQLVREAVGADLLDPDGGVEADISKLDVSFGDDGTFLGMSFYARYGSGDKSWTREIDVDAGGRVSISDAAPASDAAWVDAGRVEDAIAALDGSGLSGNRYVMADKAMDASELGAEEQVFDGTGYVSAADYAAAAHLVRLDAGATGVYIEI